MRPMGVITCAAPMNTSGNDTYLHKKFKRAPIEASEALDHQHLHPSLQREAPAGPIKAASPCIEAPLTPTNGLLAATPASTPAAAHSPAAPEGEEARRKNGRGGKYKCEYCGMGCAKPSVLDKHKRTHTNERPYSCSQCSTAFKTKSNYLKHTRSRSHAQRCDGPDGSDGATESGDNGDGEEATRCPAPQSCLPADLSLAKNDDPAGSSPASRGPQELPRDQGASIYKPKFRVRQPFSPGLEETSSPRTEKQAIPSGDPHEGHAFVTSTYHAPASSLGHPGAQPSHSGLPRHCRAPQEVRPAARKEDVPLSGPCSSATPLKSVSLWGIKSPSPELVGQHINKLIVENEAIIETHNPLWPRRYKRQPSLGSSSSESDSSGSSKSRRGSLADPSTKSSKGGVSAPTLQGQLRERSQSLTSEAIMAESRCSYSPCLPPTTPHLPLAQSVVSASKPSISLPGLTTSYSQSPPPLLESGLYDASRKRCASEGPNTPRDLTKGRLTRPMEDQADLLRQQHPRNPEGSVIKNLLLGQQGHLDQRGRFLPHSEVGSFPCPRCRIPCRSLEDLDMHVRHFCSQRPALGGDQGTPDLVKNGEGGRWAGEQDVALDLQKKPDPVDVERTSSQGSVGMEEHSQESHLQQHSPKVYRSRSAPEGASPPVKKRKTSASDERPLPFPSKGLEGSKLNNHQLFGGEVQICDGHERKTLRIDPGQPASPALDICIPPQQLGAAGLTKAETSVPTSVVVTIAKSSLHSGGTMVQVESQLGNTTKTTPSLTPAVPRPEQPPPPIAKVTPSSRYTEAGSQFSSFPCFMEFAPHLQLPNLAIPGIPTPDLASLSFTTYCPRVPNPALLHTQAAVPHAMLNNHKQTLARSPVGAPRVSPTPPFQGSQGSASSGVIHAGGGRTSSTEPGPGLPQPRDKEKDALIAKGLIKATGQGFPTLIPFGDTKVPHVPGIPGPYSQSNLVCPMPSAGQRRPPAVFTLPSQTSSTFSTTITSVPAGSPREPGLTVPRQRDPPRSPGREHNLAPGGNIRLTQRLPPKDLLSPRPRPSIASPSPRVPDLKPITPEVKPHLPPSEDKTPEKTTASTESQEPDNPTKGDWADQEEFLPPRKRPNFLALKPQPFTPKSSLALIGTTLVSPDTPRPKKSCVQMFLNGSAYTYLGHKVSTKSYFCCIYRPQPMFVLQSTDPKLSMYSNWQSKPAKEHPFKLEPYSAMSLYQSCKRDRTFTIAQPKELDLIQTHSTYWTFKQAKEKHKEEDKARPGDKDPPEVKSEELCGVGVAKAPEANVADGTGLVIKREAEDASRECPSRSSDESEGAEGSGGTKRIKIFEGGFKSTEDYTYVRGRGRGRYVCGTCGIRCKKPSMLRKHCRTHTDLRPYACIHCSFSFKTKGNLTKHLRSKAHYKRCVEMGVVPVPTVVDESHVNEAALALQGKLEQEKKPDGLDGEDDDEDEDDEEEEDGDDDDEDEEDEVGMDGNQFQDAANEHLKQGVPVPSTPLISTLSTAVSRTGEGVATSLPRSGVLVMQHAPLPLPPSSFTASSSSPPASTSTSTSVTTATVSLNTTTTTTTSSSASSISSPSSSSSSSSPSSRTDCPMDLSVRRSSCGTDKGTPRRPSFLPVLSRLSVLEPSNLAASPSTPSTPIREHPSEILSPVTETSSLLKSIYQTTERAAQASCVVLDPSVESGSSRSMLHAYLKERAVLDTAIKRQQYSSSSDGSPDSPHLPPGETQAHQQQGTTELKEVKEKEGGTPPASLPNNTTTTITSTATSTVISSSTTVITTANQPPSSSSSSSSSTSSTSRMPTPPANLTVMNSGGLDTKTAFLVPSGVVPSSLNRLSSDDGKCKCTFCHKEFNRQSQLSLHMNIHYMERPFRCESCAVSFRTNGHLQKHKRSVSHFNKVNMNNTFGTPSTDNPRPFKCHDCKIAFRIHGHLAKHLRSKMHIMKLECLGKLPFGTYAEIERSGANLNEIDTTDCDNSLESLQAMASRLYEKEPTKLAAWRTQQGRQHQRVRTISNSSTNSDDYPLQDDQDDPVASCGHDDDTEGDDDEEVAGGQRDGTGRSSVSGVVVAAAEGHTQQLPSSEIGGLSATPGLLVCHLCHEKFLDLERLSGHLYSVHKVTYRNS